MATDKRIRGEVKPPAAKKDEINMDNFDPNSEFADDPTAYDIQYYHSAIFLQKGSREEIKYPYLPSGQLNLGAVEQDLKGLSPLQIAQTYLSKEIQPVFGKKTREYFESILKETGSAEIFHADKANNEFAYSKLIIKRILSFSNWGIPLTQGRQLNTYQAVPNMYNFYDYIHAWDNILLYENNQQKHFWWIKFNLTEIDQNIPNWFLTFFFSWGAAPIIFPRNIKEIWRKFQKTNNHLESLPAVLQFVNQYSVPWIIRWDYQTQRKERSKNEVGYHPTILIRRTFLKWWPKEDFFAEGRIFYRRRILSVKKQNFEIQKNLNAQTPTKDSLLKELFQTMDKESIKKMMSEVFGSSSTTQSTGESSSKEEDTKMEDYQEAQDQNADAEEEFQKTLAIYCGSEDKSQKL